MMKSIMNTMIAEDTALDVEEVADYEPDEIGDDVEIDDAAVFDKCFQFAAPAVVGGHPHHQE